MTPQETISAEDWTRNWQASIAVKISAIVLWAVILTSFVTLIFAVWKQEQVLRVEKKQEVAYLQDEINEYIEKESSTSFEELLRFIEPEAERLEYSGFELSIFGEQRLVGAIPDDHDMHVVSLNIPAGPTEDDTKSAQVTVYHPAYRTLALAESRNLIFGVVLAITLFGALLTWTIHISLSKPFKTLINATQLVSGGDLNVKLDTSRGDEFGKISLFFNDMVSVLSEQQRKLLSANEELKSENEVRLLAEKSLILYRDHLEKTVIQRTEDFEAARDQAMMANQAKSAFIANMSHEMRTPLTAIIGFGELILSSSSTMAQRMDAAQTVSRNGRHLLKIINDILDMSKMEAGKLDVEKISMSPFHLLSDVWSLISMQAEEKGLLVKIYYEFPLPSSISSDPTRLKQILLNLCSNAVKFTEKGSVRINVSCNVDKQQMMFQVVDSGIGLSETAQQKLFSAFSQADSTTTRKYGGTGLGLFISKRLAQILGGDILVESREGVGSKFTVTIDTGPLAGVPFLDELTESEGHDEVPASELSKLKLCGKLLLAEDSIDNQRLITLYLRQAGLTDITVVDNGKLALDQALSNDFDLILMDMQMPVMGGLEAVVLLRAAGYSKPVYALTANAMKEDQDNYISAGCDGFLSKPIDQNKFFKVLAERLPAVSDNNSESAELNSTDDYEDEFEQMTRDFVSKLPAHRAALEDAAAKSDWEALRSLAHKLKGIGGSFGFSEITRLAAPLEASLKAGTMGNVSVQQTALLAEINRICAEAKVG